MAVSKPMTPVSLPWLNDGAETKLGSTPVKGEQRLETLRTEGADIVAQDYQAFMCHFRGSLLAAKDAIKDIGASEAQKQWMILYGEYENLRWDEASFEASIDQAIQDYVLKPLKVKTAKEAVKAIEEEARALNKKSTAAFTKRRREWQQDLRLEEVFWMLWQAQPKPIFMPDPTKVPSEAEIEQAKTHMAYFIDDANYAALIKAQRGVVPLKANQDILSGPPMTDEVVRKNARPTSKP